MPQAFLDSFPDAPAVTRTDVHPGGTVVYYGAYHGGKVFLITDGNKKREFLEDYIYEAMGFPWSSQILPVSAAELARYGRGPHIGTYPDGWILKKGNYYYLTQGGALRWITGTQIIAAMGYNLKYAFSAYPQFYAQHSWGQPIISFGAAKATITASGLETAKRNIYGAASPGVAAVPGASRMPPEVAKLMNELNTIFLTIYDRDPTAAENKFWLDYLYKGEAQTKAALVAALKGALATGKMPSITPRNAEIGQEKLLRYVDFLFYFVFGRFPDTEEKNFWRDRVTSGLRRTIEDLGGNMQYLKEQGLTRR